MRVKCYSVKLASLASISPKCYKAVAFDGSEALIPKSQVFGQDWDVQKSDAYWISAWILEHKNIQYSAKKAAWIDSDTGKILPTVKIQHHTPERKEPLENNTIKRLKK